MGYVSNQNPKLHYVHCSQTYVFKILLLYINCVQYIRVIFVNYIFLCEFRHWIKPWPSWPTNLISNPSLEVGTYLQEYLITNTTHDSLNKQNKNYKTY